MGSDWVLRRCLIRAFEQRDAVKKARGGSVVYRLATYPQVWGTSGAVGRS